MDVVLYQKLNSMKRTMQDVLTGHDTHKIGQALGVFSRIKYGSYAAAQSSATPFGVGAATNSKYFLNCDNSTRIRQKGVATKIQIVVRDLTSTTNFYFQIWRLVATGNWKLVYQEDILSKLQAGSAIVNEVELAQPVKVEEGDYIGGGVVGSTGINQLYLINGAPSAMYYVSDVTPTPAKYAWSTSIGQYVPIVVFGNSPDFVTIGDSIIAGHPGNYSFIESSNSSVPNNTIAYNVAQAFGWTYQNMGIGGQTSSQISSRFSTDVVGLKPAIALIEGGVNDITGANDSAPYIANMKSMIDSCVAAGIIPVVLKILPWTNGTTVQNQTRDSWNIALANLVATYPTAILVDANAAVGQFRSGGDSGNLWDIQPAYNADGIHYTASGYQAIGQKIVDAIKAKWF